MSTRANLVLTCHPPCHIRFSWPPIIAHKRNISHYRPPPAAAAKHSGSRFLLSLFFHLISIHIQIMSLLSLLSPLSPYSLLSSRSPLSLFSTIFLLSLPSFYTASFLHYLPALPSFILSSRSPLSPLSSFSFLSILSPLSCHPRSLLSPSPRHPLGLSSLLLLPGKRGVGWGATRDAQLKFGSTPYAARR
jgi:hypothetical protein